MSRLAAGLLLHVNLLLAMLYGAAVMTGVRLRLDPSLYVAARALLPAETRVASTALLLAPLALLALAHLPLAALLLASRHAARVLYILYAVLMSVAAVCEAAWAAWTAAHVVAWLHSAQAQHLQELLAALQHLQPLVNLLAQYNTLPAQLNSLVEEVEADAPCNLVALYVAGGILLALQAAGVALAALCAARLTPARSAPPSYSPSHSPSIAPSLAPDEKAPLKAVYKDGKLVIL